VKKTEAKTLRVEARGLNGLAFWAGSDHYSLLDACRRRPFQIPLTEVKRVLRIAFRDIPGFQEDRYLIEYFSGRKECMVILEALPPDLQLAHRPEKISPFGVIWKYLDLFRREPTAMLLPLALPLGIALVMTLFGFLSDLVLKNPDVLGFLARPGCEADCVEKVLRLHSLVGLLFIIQLFLLLMPFSLLFFHAPRYRYAFNVRVTQIYSVAAAVVGVFIFAQLVVFFPFRQYGRFVAMGLDPKVERLLIHLNEQKKP
jgi:hypothetical protein